MHQKVEIYDEYDTDGLFRECIRKCLIVLRKWDDIEWIFEEET